MSQEIPSLPSSPLPEMPTVEVWCDRIVSLLQSEREWVWVWRAAHVLSFLELHRYDTPFPEIVREGTFLYMSLPWRKRIIGMVWRGVHRERMHGAAVQEALQSNRLDDFVNEAAPSSSLLVPFLLSMIYIVSLEHTEAGYDAVRLLKKIKETGSLSCTPIPVQELCTAMLGRTLRFYDPSTEPLRSTHYFNAKIERERLELTTRQILHVLRQLQMKEQNRERQRVSRQTLTSAFVTSMQTIRRYWPGNMQLVVANLEFLFRFRHHLDLSLFTEEWISLLARILEVYPQANVPPSVITSSLAVIGTLMYRFQRVYRHERVARLNIKSIMAATLRAVTVAENLMHDSTCSRYHPLATFLLGASLGPLRETVKGSRIAAIMAGLRGSLKGVTNDPESLRHIATGVLCAISAETSLTDSEELVSAFLSLWDSAPSLSVSQGPPPVLEGMMIILELFRSIAREWGKRDRTGRWLTRMAAHVRAAYRKRGRATRHAAIFAAAGLLHVATPAQDALRELLIEAAVSCTKETERDITSLLHAVAVVEGRVLFVTHPDPDLAHLVRHAFFGYVLDVSWFLDPATWRMPRPQADALVMKFLRGLLFPFANKFVEALARAFHAVDDARFRHETLTECLTYAMKLHTGWTKVEATQRRGDDNRMSEDQIVQLLQSIALSLIMFLHAIQHSCDADLQVLVVNVLSYVAFCRVDAQEYRKVMKGAVDTIRKAASAMTTLARLAPSFADDSTSPPKRAGATLGEPTAWRKAFFLLVFELLVVDMPTQITHDILVPSMFQSLCSHAKVVGHRAHGLARTMFLRKIPIRAKLVPTYLRLSLQGYPTNVPIEWIAPTFSAMIRSFNDEPERALYCIQLLGKHIKKLLSASANVGSPLQLLLAQQLLVVDTSILRSVMTLVREVIEVSPHRHRRALLEGIYELISTNLDYTRRLECIMWYFELLRAFGSGNSLL